MTVPVGIKVRAKTQNPTPDSEPINLNPDPKPQPKRGKTGHKHAAAPSLHRTRKFSIADDDSEVQTALRNLQVNHIPKDLFSQITNLTYSTKG